VFWRKLLFFTIYKGVIVGLILGVVTAGARTALIVVGQDGAVILVGFSRLEFMVVDKEMSILAQMIYKS
jgi:hypothetical protein